ncbi:MAG: chemotaxis protein CheB [Oleiphilaceae bacterium]|nr:chemotaxis protein CheB [Oleiphilaceae bacterium]
MAGLTVPKSMRRILVGGSAGSINQLKSLLGELKPAATPPIVLLVHLSSMTSHDRMCEVVSEMLNYPCAVAQHGTRLEAGKIYMPQASYHLLVEPVSNVCQFYDDDAYCFAKPSIDLLFSSCVGPEAAYTLAVLLSGANDDGATGLAGLHTAGALCAVADPDLSVFPKMPLSALERQPGLRVLNPVRLTN